MSSKIKSYSAFSSKHKSRKKLLIASLVVLLLVAGAGGFFLHSKKANRTVAQPASTLDQPINYNPPTAEEKQQTDDNKQALSDRKALEEKAATNPQPAQKTATPIITNAGKYEGNIEVGAFVQGVYEDGAVCILTAKNGGNTVTKQVPAVKDATTMRCQNFVIPRTEFASSGTWQITVTYKSPTVSGTSEAKAIEVK